MVYKTISFNFIEFSCCYLIKFYHCVYKKIKRYGLKPLTFYEMIGRNILIMDWILIIACLPVTHGWKLITPHLEVNGFLIKNVTFGDEINQIVKIEIYSC